MISFEKHNFFNILDEEAKKYFIDNSYLKRYEKGSILFYRGEILNKCCFVKSGSVKFFLNGDKQETLTISRITKNMPCIISAISTITSTPAITSAEVLENSEIFFLSRNDMLHLMSKNANIQKMIYEDISLTLYRLSSLIEDLSFKTLKNRVLEYLENSDSLVITSTHKTIASELGTTREVVSKILKTLEKDGQIKLGRGKIDLINIKKEDNE